MFELVEGKEGTTLVVRGDVTVQNALGLRDALAEWIERSGTLNLDLDGVEEADLTFLQLLCSVGKSIKKMGKNLDTTKELPDSIVEVAKQAGFFRGYERRDGKQNVCDWIMGDGDEQ